MRVYTVHQDPVRPPENAEFVKDGFCWPALFVPLLWLIYRRLWLGLILWLVLSTALVFVVGAAKLDDIATAMVFLGFNILVAFEANDWLRRTLERHGRRHVATVAAPNLAAAEMRYYQLGTVRPAPAPPPFPAAQQRSAPVPRSVIESPALGFYPQPEAKR